MLTLIKDCSIFFDASTEYTATNNLIGTDRLLALFLLTTMMS